MKRQAYQDEIIDYLSRLRSSVELNNSISLTDINHNAEYFYCELLNLICSLNLTNINTTSKNAAAIDLGDEQNGIAIQVTSTSTLEKTRDTVNKFVKNKLTDKYSRLVILNIVKKSNHRDKYIGDIYKLDTKKDIWDVQDLMKIIGGKGITEQKTILVFLKSQLDREPASTIPKEVNTILNLIECISDEDHAGVGNGYLEEPFPAEKITKRFHEHSSYLQDQFIDLNIEYGSVYSAIKDEYDIGQVKLRRVARYLKDYSDTVLTECNDDPRVALEEILRTFEKMLCENGHDFDAGAIKFYVIREITNCNIFPNRITIDAQTHF